MVETQSSRASKNGTKENHAPSSTTTGTNGTLKTYQTQPKVAVKSPNIKERYLRGEKSAEVTRERISPQPSPVGSHGSNGALSNGAHAFVNGGGGADTQESPRPSFWWTFLRSVLVDIPLATLFAIFLLAWFLRSLHGTFYKPLLKRAYRDDDQLLDEHTYYQRQCNQYDLTTDDMDDMVIKPEHSLQDGLDVMMTHGLGIIPQILSPETTANLRDYIVRRNAAIPAQEQYPMSEGYNRLSYGIEPMEDESVAKAVQEVANHPVFKPLITSLLGDDDPASSEITAITNFPGCSLQVWHQDTKTDGNALKFARTFSHSYSLFLPLQNITAAMGGTDICPGTHYCTNDLGGMCEANTMGMAGVDPVYGFPAGGGALFNQHVWHRGGAHSDFQAPERIVFILSFLARPKFDRDPRQLSKGTYFHQKWSMWGHTLNDMLDPLKRMRPPFSYLRCMSLWKPARANWGFDLITSGYMRIANEQMEPEDLVNRFVPRLVQFHFPKFLWGEILQGEPQLRHWSVFINGTLNKSFEFFGYVALGMHAMYGIFLLVRAYINRNAGNQPKDRPGPFLQAIRRLCWSHGLLLVMAATVWYRILVSPWGVGVRSGRALMRPFPATQETRYLESKSVPYGLTTMPTRWDVLIGSRFDADFLGAYDKWLDYHPGNVELQDMIDQYASSYTFYKGASSHFRTSVIDWVVGQIRARDGRFLQQDYRTGEWIILNENEVLQAVSDAMLTSRVETIGKLVHTLDWMIAEKRFGYGRRSPLSMFTHLLLLSIRRSLLVQDITPQTLEPAKASPWRARVTKVPTMSLRKRKSLHSPPFHERHSFLPDQFEKTDDFQEGSLVWWITEETQRWFPGTVLGRSPCGDWFRVSSNDYALDVNVHHSDLRKFKPITEGDLITGCMAPQFSDCYFAVVDKVLPGGELSVAFSDGDYEEALLPDQYFQYPFVYEGPIA